MFLGAFVHMALRWLIVEKNDQSDKMMEIDQLVDMLAIAISNKEVRWIRRLPSKFHWMRMAQKGGRMSEEKDFRHFFGVLNELPRSKLRGI